MKKINFIFGVHNHQPVGNYDDIFEMAIKMAYQPFLDTFKKYPEIKIVLHYTGPLIDYFEKKDSKILNDLKSFVKKGQAEILTGGYYEPIMSIISDKDKIGQIKKLSDYIYKKFSYKSKGMWLAERVWEPSLAKALNEAGVEYVVLDDAPFLSLGIEEKKLKGYYITEEQGFKLNIFPINQKLRYLTPFAEPEETIKYLKNQVSEDPADLIIMVDDGEKFGLWPETNKTCYEKKWLERFLILLKENADWINTTTFSEYIRNYPARDRIYLPAVSYFEMSEWALPSKAQLAFEEVLSHADTSTKRFLKGGFWRNFLTKYSESNNMHKKMLYVSDKIQSASIAKTVKPEVIEQATNAIYRSQCNCAYWHGVFGGLYLPHLRSAIYKNIIDAENLLNLNSNNSFEVIDYDKDGQDEVILSGKNINIYAKPFYGGTITEMDFKPLSLNLTNILTRRFEAYHKKVDVSIIKKENEKAEPIKGAYYTKELGLQKYLRYDWYNRYSLIDHFFHGDTNLEKYSCGEYGEVGDFVNQPYDLEISNGKKEKSIILKRNGYLWLSSGLIPVETKKIISINESTTNIQYQITNNSEKDWEFWYGCEFNFGFSNPFDDNCIYSSREKKENFSTVTSFNRIDSFMINDIYNNLKLKMDLSDSFDFWVFPIWTISLSEGGFEKTYQGSSITLNKKIYLKSKEKYNFTLKIEPKKIR
ncbi:MAG: hypothetical protein A2474_04180 [Elusimicrobia bacterium RIFOXYC2_FULL_34_12]|nr:MAG: hypothetical protein A2474_04180 [Elusimicrobia bacterium RIFOXYC2_FULL_34_12]OGS38694.1 MAG: hypothetical protein A2551_01805 [Elusimicrobia bacterium RIFOXYD2_FULL_34_30]HAM39410.1 4-alpha-glucanotransferase [Elusimicrobiota bacterium]